MLAISGMHKGETKLTIPNQVVREQLFAYILDTYHENDLTFDSYEKRKLASGLAYDGKWKPYFEYIAGCLHRYASQQDKQKGEYFVHGFTLAIYNPQIEMFARFKTKSSFHKTKRII